MVVYLPCKLGEKFERLKFKSWEDGKRVYESSGAVVLKGFHAFECQTSCLAISTIICNGGSFLSYDPSGEFGQEFVPRYKLMLDMKSAFKLSDKGFPGSRRVRLGGIYLENGKYVADFVTCDRYEHLRYPIKEDCIRYVPLDGILTQSTAEPVRKMKLDDPSDDVSNPYDSLSFSDFVQASLEDFINHAAC